MQVNKFVTMAVGLIVAVVLVSGLMVPIISSVSSDDGGSVTYRNDTMLWGGYYNQPTSNTDIILESVCYDNEPFIRCTIDGETREWQTNTAIFGDTWTVSVDIIERGDAPEPEYIGLFGYQLGERTAFSNTLHISGSTVSFVDDEFNDEYVLENIIFYSWYEGDFVIPDPSSPIYLSNDSVIRADLGNFDIGNAGSYVTICGNVLENNSYLIDWETMGVTPLDSSVFSISNNHLLESISISVGGVSYEISIEDEDNPCIWSIIVPTEISIGSGGSSSISPTLATLLSVIPLITVVGIIIGMIGFIRMKE